MSKQILHGKEAREKLLKGLDTVCNAVKVTIGPKGRNWVLEGGYEPTVANDAGTIAKEIILKDKIENMGAQFAKGVIQKTSEKVGGGRTASAILLQSLVHEGIKQDDKGMNINLIKKGMQMACKDITENLKKIARPCETKEQLKQVATISTESDELGEVIAEVVHKVGKDGIVTVEEGQTNEITTKFTEGLEFDKGFISPYMITNEKEEAVYEDVAVLVTDRKIGMFKELVPALEAVVKSGKKDLVIIAEDIEGNALQQCIINKINPQGGFGILAIKAPSFGENKKACLEDLAKLVGGTLLTEQNWAEAMETTKTMRNTPSGTQMLDISIFKDGILGKANKVISTKDTTKIIEGKGDIKAHIEKLKEKKDKTESKMEQSRLDERIAKLSNSVAIIKVGANSDKELKYLKLKIEDGVSESKRALEEGIVPGGDVVFIHGATLKKLDNDEQSIGYNIVLKAIEAPLRQIVINGNNSPDVIISKVQNNTHISGYNALTNEIVQDMFECGIIDAVKVSRTVLENAVSAASMFLTIEGTISEEDDKEPTRRPIEY